MFGRTEEEICCIGRKGVTDLSDTRLKDFLRIRSEKGKVKSEVSLLRKDGSKFPAEVSSSLFTDKDGKLRSSMVIRDISERKKAEQEIKKVKELLEQVFASLTDTLFVVDVEDEVVVIGAVVDDVVVVVEDESADVVVVLEERNVVVVSFDVVEVCAEVNKHGVVIDSRTIITTRSRNSD